MLIVFLSKYRILANHRPTERLLKNEAGLPVSMMAALYTESVDFKIAWRLFVLPQVELTASKFLTISV